MFKHSQYQISEATYVFDPKKLQKESRRERRKTILHSQQRALPYQNHPQQRNRGYYSKECEFSRGLCLTKTTCNKETGASFRGLWIRAGADWRSDTLTSLALRKGWFMKFLLSSKGDKTREKCGSPTKLALASNKADKSPWKISRRIPWTLSCLLGLEINGQRLG